MALKMRNQFGLELTEIRLSKIEGIAKMWALRTLISSPREKMLRFVFLTLYYRIKPWIRMLYKFSFELNFELSSADSNVVFTLLSSFVAF